METLTQTGRDLAHVLIIRKFALAQMPCERLEQI